MNRLTLTEELIPFAKRLSSSEKANLFDILISTLDGTADESGLNTAEYMVYRVILLTGGKKTSGDAIPGARRRGRPRKMRLAEEGSVPGLPFPSGTEDSALRSCGGSGHPGNSAPAVRETQDGPAEETFSLPVPGETLSREAGTDERTEDPLPFPESPTLPEVEQYARERSSPVDPRRFLEFNSKRSWTVNGDPVRDWKALFRTWEKWEHAPGSRLETAIEKIPRAAQYTQRRYTEKDLSWVSDQLIREAMEDTENSS